MTQAVDMYLESFNMQEAVLKTMKDCKEPDVYKCDYMFANAIANKKKIFKLGKPSGPGKPVLIHMRAIEDSVNLWSWFQLDPEDKKVFGEVLAEFAGGIDFKGSELASLAPAINKEWYQSFRKVHNDFANFLKANYPKVMQWTGSSDDVKLAYTNHVKMLGSGGAPAAPVEEKKDDPPAPAAPVKAAPVKKAAPKKKEPTKVLKMSTWELCDFGDETITFDEDDVSNNMAFNLFNCNKTKLVIGGKIRNVMFSRCKRCEVTLDECISMVEVLKSEATKIRA